MKYLLRIDDCGKEESTWRGWENIPFVLYAYHERGNGETVKLVSKLFFWSRWWIQGSTITFDRKTSTCELDTHGISVDLFGILLCLRTKPSLTIPKCDFLSFSPSLLSFILLADLAIAL